MTQCYIIYYDKILWTMIQCYIIYYDTMIYTMIVLNYILWYNVIVYTMIVLYYILWYNVILYIMIECCELWYNIIYYATMMVYIGWYNVTLYTMAQCCIISYDTMLYYISRLLGLPGEWDLACVSSQPRTMLGMRWALYSNWRSFLKFFSRQDIAMFLRLACNPLASFWPGVLSTGRAGMHHDIWLPTAISKECSWHTCHIAPSGCTVPTITSFICTHAVDGKWGKAG